MTWSSSLDAYSFSAKKMLFCYNELIERMETKHLRYLFICRVHHCTISAFTMLDLYSLSRGHTLHKQISAESKLPLPNT